MIIYDYVIDEKEIIGIGPLMQRVKEDRVMMESKVNYEFDLLLQNYNVRIVSPSLDIDRLREKDEKELKLQERCKNEYEEVKKVVQKLLKPKVAKRKTIQR